MWQTIIHVVFLLSALAIAYTDKLIHSQHSDAATEDLLQPRSPA